MGLEKEVDSLTGPEMEVVTVVFHQFETGLREGTIYTRVSIEQVVCTSSKIRLERALSAP